MPDDRKLPTAALHLPNKYSCKSGFAVWQWALVTLIGAGLIASIIKDPWQAYEILFPVIAVLFWGALALRAILLVVGSALQFAPSKDVRFRQIPETELPVYSVLVALYREAPIVRQLLSELSAIDWPKHKLDVQLLVEADDFETRLEIERVGLPNGMRMTLVPGGGPRTKPNALNYGLLRVRGDFVCCFDAEDRPDPGQLREAYARFRSGSDRLAVLQAPLVGTARREDWLAQHWSLEYAVAFGLVMPGMSALRIPLPLGGTSNHFRTRVLKALGGWDAWNVTEDADIGLRLARAGYSTGMLRSPTLEAAPVQYGVWLRQRTRWIKGFLMTYAVLMRSPVQLLRQLGVWRFLAVQLTFGTSTLTHFIYAPAIVLTGFSMWDDTFELGVSGWALFCAGLGLSTFADLIAPGRWTYGRFAALLTRPLYWPLHSVAAYRALIELVRRPFYWAKTPHVPEHTEEAQIECSTGSSALPLPSLSRSSVSSRIERQAR